MRTTTAAVILVGLTLTAALAGCQPAATDTVETPAAEAEAPVAPVAATAFTDPATGIAFDHADTLTTGPCDAETPNCIGLFDAEGGEALVRIETYPGDLATVAREQAGFEPNAEGQVMTTYGRFDPVRVEDVSGEGWNGQRAIITCGVSDEETGFHAAGGECLWGVASDGTRSVMVSSNGFSPSLEAGEQVLSTLRLTAPVG